MSARVLDGTATARADPRGTAAPCRGVHRRARTAARARHRARRRRPGVGHLRSQQAEVGGGDGTAGGPRTAAGHAPRLTTSWRPWRASTPARLTTASSCSRRCRRPSGPTAEQLVFDAVDPAKDVDGFHPENVGRLVQRRPHAGALHAARRSSNCSSAPASRSPARAPSSSAAATSWASRWRCCCCTGTPRSPSATRARATSPPSRPPRTSW